jgi:hypothetical protein
MNRMLKSVIAVAAALMISAATLFTSPVAQAAPAATTDLGKLVTTDFKVTADKYYNEMGYSSNHYNYTEDEVKMLAIVIYLEVRGSSYRSKLAVGNVIMNRVLSPGYPGNTIKEVVTRPNQFAYKPSINPTAECIKAARDVLEHEMWVVPQSTYFFRATSSKADWGRHKFYQKIDSTTFYTDSYAGRSNLKTVPMALYQRDYKWPQYGCKPSARVRKVQIMLNALGYKFTTDGWFGQATKDALIKFQQANGLTADGVAGPATLKKLITKYGVSKYLKL